jgi:hypothetical protein
MSQAQQVVTQIVKMTRIFLFEAKRVSKLVVITLKYAFRLVRIRSHHFRHFYVLLVWQTEALQPTEK